MTDERLGREIFEEGDGGGEFIGAGLKVEDARADDAFEDDFRLEGHGLARGEEVEHGPAEVFRAAGLGRGSKIATTLSARSRAGSSFASSSWCTISTSPVKTAVLVASS